MNRKRGCRTTQHDQAGVVGARAVWRCADQDHIGYRKIVKLSAYGVVRISHGTPGGPMPPVEGCNKKDYTVLFMIGVAVEN